MSGTVRPARDTNLADGEWHRLHPASPLLRGGLVFLAVLGFVVANLRERLVDMFLVVFAPELGRDLGTRYDDWENDWAGDPIGGIVANGLVGWAVAGLGLLIVAVIAGFWLSWRMHTFRVTNEAVEVRSGILFRSHRSARLDRIQGINVTRPLFARLFGTAKLEVSVAGQSGDVQLAYLGSALVDGLRADILRLASGVRAAKSAASDVANGAASDGAGTAREAGDDGRPHVAAVINQRVDEFLAPELDPSLAPPESVVHLPLGRVIASTLLGGSTIWAIILVGLIATGLTTGQYWMLFSFVPAAIGIVSYAWSRITKSLRYSIAGTPDGVRIGHGLLSTGNQTIPPGRIHAIEVTQWLFWRPFGWWSVRINVAGQSVSASNEAAQRTLVLPVGTVADVRRVLALLLPDAAADIDPFVDAGLVGRDGDGDYSRTVRRGAWLRPFSWRRIGWAAVAGIALIRRGWLVRRLALVPLARMQSVGVTVGPIERMLRLATVRIHTVAGPVTAVLPATDRDEAFALFERLADEAVARAASDTSHHWRAEVRPAAVAAHSEPSAPSAPSAPSVPSAETERSDAG